MKIKYIICILLLLTSCSQITLKPEQPPEPTETPTQPTPSVTPSETPNKFGFVSFRAEVATDAEAKIIAEAAGKLATVIRSDCFRDFLVSRKMIQTEKRTPEEVYNHLVGLSGDIKVKMYYKRFTSASAYTEIGSDTINLNRKFYFTKLPVCEWSSVLAHEGYGHAIGKYTHDFYYSDSRNYSVPYSLNSAVEHCCR